MSLFFFDFEIRILCVCLFVCMSLFVCRPQLLLGGTEFLQLRQPRTPGDKILQQAPRDYQGVSTVARPCGPNGLPAHACIIRFFSCGAVAMTVPGSLLPFLRCYSLSRASFFDAIHFLYQPIGKIYKPNHVITKLVNQQKPTNQKSLIQQIVNHKLTTTTKKHTKENTQQRKNKL